MEKLLAEDRIENPEKSSFWDFDYTSKYEFVDKWYLVGTPYPVLLITSIYLLFVLQIGKAYMKNRRPYDLRNVLIVYNAFQVFISAMMVWLCLDVASHTGFIQRSCLTDTEESKYTLATMIYYYFLCKISELLDTVFFVLRKKQNQVTFLHVYHHTIMVWNGWVFIKFEPGYWMLFVGAINSFVHIIMYSYYGLSAFPSLHKYLWWKKYITKLQLVQFVLILVQMTINLVVNECKPSRGTVFYLYFNGLLFIYLFSSFYKQAYTNNKKKVQNGENKNALNNNVDNGTKFKNQKNNGDYFANGMKSQNARNSDNYVNSKTKRKNVVS